MSDDIRFCGLPFDEAVRIVQEHKRMKPESGFTLQAPKGAYIAPVVTGVAVRQPTRWERLLLWLRRKRG